MNTGKTTSTLCPVVLASLLSVMASAQSNAAGDRLEVSPAQSARNLKRQMQLRIGVMCLPGDNVSNAAVRLSLGWYKDYAFFGKPVEAAGAIVDYVPIVTYQDKRDNPAGEELVRKRWDAGKTPRIPGLTLDDVLDSQSLTRLRQRLARDGAHLPPGTLFQLGIEPGYSPNGDDRSPAEIVQDARKIKGMLDSLGRGYSLALGGISTPENQYTKQAYRGIYGLQFFQNVLDACDGFQFDAYVVHPYPADLAHPSIKDSRDQIIAFRKIMARRGLRKTDLLVGEIGVPFRGVNQQQAVAFTSGIVEFILTATDGEIGNPRDGNRLVQKFCWFNLSSPTFKIPGFTDNSGLDFSVSALLSPEGDLTAVGKAFQETVARCASLR
jgi:hypothetical protein